jgi:hypothetical protein
MNAFEDRLSTIGTLVGAFLILSAVGTLIGTPWTYAQSSLVAVGQLVGIVATIAIGAGLVWLVTQK